MLKKIFRKIVHIFGWFVTALIAIYLILLLIVHLPPVQKGILNIIEKQGTKAISGSLSIESYFTNLLTFVDAYNIKAISTRSYQDSVFVDKIGINFSIFALLKKRIVLSNIQITGGSLYAIRDKSGRFRIPILPLPSKKPDREQKEQWKVEISTICAQEMELKYYDMQLKTVVTLKNVNGCTNIDSLNVFLSSQSLGIKSPWWNGSFDTLHIEAKLQDSLLHLSDFLLQSTENQIVVYGVVPFSENEFFDIKGRFSVADITPFSQAMVPPEHQIGGSVHSAFKLTGTLSNPLIQLTIASPFLSYRNISIDSLHLVAFYDQDESLKVNTSLYNPNASANIEASFAIDNIFSKPQFSGYQISLNGDRIDIGYVRKLLNIKEPALIGIGSVHLEAAGNNFTDLPQNATLTVAISENSPKSLDTLWAFLNVRNRSWFLRALIGKGNRFSGSGEVRLFDLLQGRIEGRFNNPAALSTFFLRYPVEGAISANASFVNGFNDPQLKLDFFSDSLHWRGFRLTELWGGLNFDKIWQIDSAQVKISSDLQDAIIPGVKDLYGNLNAQIRAEGSLFHPVIRSNLVVNNPGFQNWRAGFLTADLLYKNDRLLWDSLFLEKDTLTLRATGIMDFLKNGLTFQTSSEILANNISAIGLRSAGSLVGDSILVTTAIDYARTGFLIPEIPVSPCIEGTVRLNAVVNQEQCIRYGSLLFELTQNSVSLPNPYLYLGAITYGKKGLNGNVRIIGKKDSVSVLLVSLQAGLKQRGCIGNGLKIEDGSTIQWIARDFEFGEVLEAFIPDLFLRGMVQGNAKAIRKKGIWQLDGTLIAQAETLFYAPQMITVSRAQAQAVFGGSIDSPVMELSLSSDAVSFDRLESVNLHVNSKYSGTYIQIDSLCSNFLNGGYLRLTGLLPLSQKSRINPQLSYTFNKVPLSIVNPVIPTLFIRDGTVSGQGEIHSVSQQLKGQGKIVIDDVQFFVNNCSGMAGPFHSTIYLKNDSLILDTMYGKWGDGRVYGQGFLNGSINGIDNLKSHLQIQNVNFDCLNSFQIEIKDATADILKKSNKYLLLANIKLDDSRVEKVFTVSGLMQGFLEGERAPSIPRPLFRQTVIQALIEIDRNLLIDTNLGRFLLDGKMNITGTLANPRFNGTLQIDEGRVNYLDREFIIEEGTLKQFSDVEINPTLDITASSDVQDLASFQTQEYVISIAVRGTLRNPKFVITSNPPLEDQQIIRLLTMGSIEGGPGLGTRTGQLLSSYFTGLGSQYIEQVTGLGNVNLSGNVFTQNGGLSLSISENLTSRISVSYQTDVTDFGQYAVQIMYRVLPQIRVLGSTDSQGKSDIGLRFIYRR